MSNLSWLKNGASQKGEDIMDVADELWLAVTSNVPSAPEALKNNPHEIGKMAVVSTLGLMMYMPGLSRQIADSFAGGADIDTGTTSHVQDTGYVGKVSQALEASARMLDQFNRQSEGPPRIGATETTEDIKQFIPLFEERLSDRAAREQEQRAVEEEMAAQQPSLFSLEEEENASSI